MNIRKQEAVNETVVFLRSMEKGRRSSNHTGCDGSWESPNLYDRLDIYISRRAAMWTFRVARTDHPNVMVLPSRSLLPQFSLQKIREVAWSHGCLQERRGSNPQRWGLVEKPCIGTEE